MLNRRDAIRGVALTLGFASTGLAGQALAAASLTPLTWKPTALTSGEAGIVDVVAEIIVPATDTPGARQAGVPQFIDRALADYCDKKQAALLRIGLAQIEADAGVAHGAGFVALKPEQQAALLTRYDGEAAAAAAKTPLGPPHFFGVLKQLVLTGYFTSEPGATIALKYDPVPGDYHGCIPLSEVGRAWAT